MRENTVRFILIIIMSFTSASTRWPFFLERCSMKDSDFNSCLMEATKAAIPLVSKGISKLGLRSLDPLVGANFSIVTQSRGPVTGTIRVTNATIFGPSKLQIRRVFFDNRTSSLTIEGNHESIKMIGNYSVRGSIFLIPIQSSGEFGLEALNLLANHTLKLTNKKRDISHGRVHFKVSTIKHLKFQLNDSKLNAQGNQAVNRLVNDNWRTISNTFKPLMESVIQKMYSEALRPLTSRFSLDEFFPPNRTTHSNDVLSSDLKTKDSVWKKDEKNDDDSIGSTESSIYKPVEAYSYFIQW